VVAPPNLSLLLIMACFWLIYFIVKSQFITPLGAVLDERERRRREAGAEIEAARQAFDDTMARCEKDLALAAAAAQKHRADLRAEGEAARRSRLDAARAAGQERLARLTDELRAAADAARGELRTRAQALARELAERLLGRRLAS
jgi:F-type H+-transporting ATPase subunit b